MWQGRHHSCDFTSPLFRIFTLTSNFTSLSTQTSLHFTRQILTHCLAACPAAVPIPPPAIFLPRRIAFKPLHIIKHHSTSPLTLFSTPITSPPGPFQTCHPPQLASPPATLRQWHTPPPNRFRPPPRAISARCSHQKKSTPRTTARSSSFLLSFATRSTLSSSPSKPMRTTIALNSTNPPRLQAKPSA